MTTFSESPMSDRSAEDTIFQISSRQTSVSTDTDAVATPYRAGEKEAPGAGNNGTPLKRKKKPVPGKGFNKSRRGCYNCKRRRVKCSEASPECRGCHRMGLICVYPENSLPTPKRSNNALSASPKPGVNLDHLRFFRHFLLEAYPPAPHGAEPVWHNVAAMSHEVCACQIPPRLKLSD
jgi:hypothetical protein